MKYEPHNPHFWEEVDRRQVQYTEMRLSRSDNELDDKPLDEDGDELDCEHGCDAETCELCRDQNYQAIAIGSCDG